MATRIPVVLVEDEGLLRDLLRMSLAQTEVVEVVGDFGSGEAMLAQAARLRPRVAVLDIELGSGMTGIQAGRRLRAILPDVGVVLLSNHRHPAFFSAVPSAEIAGWSYLLKRSVSDIHSLLRAIEGAASGLVVLDPQLVDGSRPRPGSILEQLTPRQSQILALVAQGYSNDAVAEELGLTRKTVENHLNVIYEALGVDSHDSSRQPRVQAVLTFLRETRMTSSHWPRPARSFPLN